MPKGLRSFDAHDADFFLELLPGPRDRDGLPDSIRFWKTRIEETDADNTFSVGLIYGPSGCGKSSLVKAGSVAPAVRWRDRRLRRSDRGGNGNSAPERSAKTLSCPACQSGPERDAGGIATRARHSRRQEGADRPRSVRAMAACQEGRTKHRTGASPAAMRRRTGAVHRHGAGRFLAGRQPIHARPGNPARRGAEQCPGRSLRSGSRPKSAGGLRAGLRQTARELGQASSTNKRNS